MATEIKWSGKMNIPSVGGLIVCNFNNLGVAEVTGYFTEGGWLGLLVRFANPPSWYVKQNGEGAIGHVFGAEIAPYGRAA